MRGRSRRISQRLFTLQACFNAGLERLYSKPVLAAFLFQNCDQGFYVDAEKVASVQAANTFLDPKLEIISVDQRLVATASVPVELRSTIDSKVQVESLNCSLNDGEETPCPEPLVFAGLADGNYVLRVTLTDSRGLTIPCSIKRQV